MNCDADSSVSVHLPFVDNLITSRVLLTCVVSENKYWGVTTVDQEILVMKNILSVACNDKN